MLLLNHGARLGHHAQRGEGWWLVGSLLQLLLLGAIVVLAVLVGQRLTGRSAGRADRTGAVPPAPAGIAPVPDEALTELRLRYARGEVSREDYLRAAADLGPPVTAAGG